MGRAKEAAVLRPLMRSLPYNDTHDPDYRRLRYIRYADDFLLGFTGPKDEADEIKARSLSEDSFLETKTATQ